MGFCLNWCANSLVRTSTVRTSTHCKWPIKQQLWYFSNWLILYNIWTNQHDRWPFTSTKTTPDVSHSGVMWWELCGNGWLEKSAGHSLTLVIMTSDTEVMQPTSCNSDTKNQCDVIPDSSPESHWIVGIRIHFDPIWKGNLPLWWLGHTTALLYWHEWLHLIPLVSCNICR